MIWRIINNNLPIDKIEKLTSDCKALPMAIMLALKLKEESPNITFLYHISHVIHLAEHDKDFFNQIEHCAVYGGYDN